jgi:hypothetical protein
MKRLLLPIILLLPAALTAQQKDTASIRFSKTITVADLSRHLHVLASDEYEGRETGKKGQKMAAKYISEQFRSYGIPPLANGSYYQEYPLIVTNPPEVAITINNNVYTPWKDFYYFPSQPGEIIQASEVVFLGHGISDEKYNDYKGKDVKDKVVLVMSSEPMSADSIYFISGKKTPSSWSFNPFKKQNAARDKGARALLIALPDDQLPKGMKAAEYYNEHAPTRLEGSKPDSARQMPVIYISQSMANAMIAGKKKSIEKIRAAVSKSHKPVSFTANADLKITIKQNIEKIIAENVIGYIEGTDLKHEVIIVTAHYDHLGILEGKVYNGADDDGSGTVAIMEMAEAFAKAKKEGKGPRRSVMFMAISGEEKGLLGSQYYVNNPVFPLANTVANLNIDMIGRQDEKYANDPDYVYLIGSNMLSTDLHNVNEEANNLYSGLKLDYMYNNLNDKNRYYYRSDHYNFAKNNIPVIFYFNGTHKDYHKHTDEVEKINFSKMEKISRLVFHTAWELANRSERIKLDKKDKPQDK